jgi:hypothetical protein
MKQIAIILISFSLCFGAGKMPKKMEQLKQDLQEKYQVFSMDDLYKLKTPSQSSQSSNRSASRDMEDLVGDWIMEDESLELFVTVGSDQSIPDPFSTMGFVEAVGGVTATTSDFETDLNYLMIGLFGDDGPDCNMNCEGEYDNYMSYGYDVSDEYCECCHEDYPIDEICEDDDDDGDDWSPELVITNLNLIEFFMIMMGEDPDSLGVENPMVVGVSSTQTESGDIVFDEVFAMLFNEDGDGLMADSAEAVAATSVDTVENTITFTSLSLYDSTETAVLTLSGSIGPGMMDFVAGEETAFPFLEGLENLFEDNDDEGFYMSFYEDSTGMEIEVWYYDDEYYYDEPEIQMDTSYFTWSATSDSLFLYEESEYYYDELDTTALAYFISGTDTLNMEASFDPCEDEDSFEDCMEFATQEIAGLDELEDIQSLRLSMQRVLTLGSYTAVDPENGSLPSEFKLYAAYPNPFNPVATIRFDVGEASHESTLRIFDISGRNVATLISGHLESGTYEVKWDARGFASGVYFSELISGQNRHTQKMVLLK